MATYDDQSEHENERGGDADQPALSGGYVPNDGTLAMLDRCDYLPRHVHEEYARKHPPVPRAETVNVTIGPIPIDPDDYQRMQDEIARRKRESRSLLMEIGGSGSRRFNPPADGSAMTLEHFRSVPPPPQVHTKLVVSGRDIYIDFVAAPEHENAFAQWIMIRLYAMLAFQTLKGWYRPRKDGE